MKREPGENSGSDGDSRQAFTLQIPLVDNYAVVRDSRPAPATTHDAFVTPLNALPPGRQNSDVTQLIPVELWSTS